MFSPTISSVTPLRAVEGGRVTLRGRGFPVDRLPRVTIGDQEALVHFASSERIVFSVPPDLESGPAPIRIVANFSARSKAPALSVPSRCSFS